MTKSKDLEDAVYTTSTGFNGPVRQRNGHPKDIPFWGAPGPSPSSAPGSSTVLGLGARVWGLGFRGLGVEGV